MNYSTRRFYDIPPFIETSPDMKKHICWITVVFSTLVLQVRSRNLQGKNSPSPLAQLHRLAILRVHWNRCQDANTFTSGRI